MIITFYSFKGGVGRSMALANVGRWYQMRGLDVVLVDWDLEAPGLESYFLKDAAQHDAAQGRLGLLDLIATYKDLYPGLPRTARDAAGREALAALLDQTLPPLAPLLVTLPGPPPSPAPAATAGAGRLRLLTAGRRSASRFADYAETVQRFDWSAFYAEFDGAGYFDWLRRQLIEVAGADVVLIDSRTGVAEMSGVCTRQLADIVVSFCAPNDQNLTGVARMAESFVRPDVLEARNGRALGLVMVPARLDISEGRPIDLFEATFQRALDRYMPPAFRRAGTSFIRLRIPYISAYAFAERLAVGEPEGVKSMQEAYATLAVHLALLAPSGTALRQRCRADLQAAFGMPTVLVGAIDPQAAQLAPALRERLEEAGVFAMAMAEGDARDGLCAPGTVLLIAGAAALHDGRLRAISRMAGENGVCLFVCTDRPPADTQALPRWPRALRLWDAEREWDELLSQLQRPCQVRRVPFLAPPAPALLLGRERELADLARLVRMPDQPGGMIALLGMGGIGKSALACMLCHDDTIADTFDGGILWLGLGPLADLRTGLVKLLRAFEPADDEGALLDLDEVRRRLTDLLETRRCLIVYNDVVDSTQLELLPRGGAGCRVLLLTRSTTLVAELPPHRQLTLGPLPDGAARDMLMAELMSVGANQNLVQTLAHRLGSSPAALALANKALRSRSEPHADVAAALDELLRELDRSGLAALELLVSGGQGGALFETLNAATERLPSADRARLPALAALGSGRQVPIAELAQLLQIGADDAVQLARRLDALWLAEYQPHRQTLLIAPLTHEYLRSLQIQQERVTQTRTLSSSAPGSIDTLVYISYRHQDAARHAHRLYSYLAAELGPDRVWMDVAEIDLGRSFEEIIAQTLERASAVVVVIGPDWLDGRGAEGRRRLDDPSDFVRLEIAYALARDKRVIPVLVSHARMPAVDDLPPELAALTRRNALALSGDNFATNADRLIEALTHSSIAAKPADAGAAVPAWSTMATPPSGTPASLPPRTSAPRRRLVAAGVIAVVAAAGMLAWRSLRVDAPSAAGAADFADAEALFYGRAGRKDVAQAIRLYQRAAAAGNPSAQNSLGRLYESGDGVLPDRDAALDWYRKAAEQGHPDARATLARMLPAQRAMQEAAR